MRTRETGGDVVGGVGGEEYAYSCASREKAVGRTGAIGVDDLRGRRYFVLFSYFGVFGYECGLTVGRKR